MSWEHIQTTLVGFAVSAIVAVVGRYFGWKVSTEQQKQVQWAIEQGVAYAAERFRKVPATPMEKQETAHQMAHSLAPKALDKVGDAQTRKLIDATYARMRASLPNTSFVMKGDDIPVDVVDVPLSDRPTPLPPPKVKPR